VSELSGCPVGLIPYGWKKIQGTLFNYKTNPLKKTFTWVGYVGYNAWNLLLQGWQTEGGWNGCGGREGVATCHQPLNRVKW